MRGHNVSEKDRGGNRGKRAEYKFDSDLYGQTKDAYRRQISPAAQSRDEHKERTRSFRHPVVLRTTRTDHETNYVDTCY